MDAGDIGDGRPDRLRAVDNRLDYGARDEWPDGKRPVRYAGVAASQPEGAPISAVAIEPANPSELMSLIQGGNITIPVQESVATTSNGPQTLLFDEGTGALSLTVDNQAPPSRRS